MCLSMNFIDRKEPRKTVSADVDGSAKTFFKNVAIVLPRHPKKLPPRRNVSPQAMLFIGWCVADSPPRPTQHKRNVLFSCLVASEWGRTKCWRHAGDLEIHRCCAVADFLGRVLDILRCFRKSVFFGQWFIFNVKCILSNLPGTWAWKNHRHHRLRLKKPSQEWLTWTIFQPDLV